MPELEFKTHGEITPKQLAELSRSQTIVRSAHLGNVGLYNLAGAAKLSAKKRSFRNPGVTLLLLDRNLLGRDTNYRPKSVIFNQAITPVLRAGGKDVLDQPQPDFLTPFSPISEQMRDKLAKLLGVSQSEIPGTLAGLHYKTAKKAYGQGAGTVVTWSEYLNSHEKLLRSILNAWVKAGKYNVFDRVIIPGGQLAHLTSSTPRNGALFYQTKDGGSIKRVQIEDLVQFTLNANRSLAHAVKTGTVPEAKSDGNVGVMFNVEASTALGALLEARKAHPSGTPFNSERMAVYHLSGPDYIKYGSKADFVKEVSELVSLAKPAGAFPKTIEFHLLPQTNLNLAGNSATAKKLEEIIAHWKGLSALQKEKGEKIKAAQPTEKRQLIGEYDSRIRTFRDVLSKKILALKIHFVDHASVLGLRRTTIYDIVHGDHGPVHLPRNARNMTLTEMGKLQKFIDGVVTK